MTHITTSSAEAFRVSQFDAVALPTLTGSPKQVAWANKIRDSFKKYAIKANDLNAYTNIIKGYPTARKWIDTRDSFANVLRAGR